MLLFSNHDLDTILENPRHKLDIYNFHLDMDSLILVD